MEGGLETVTVKPTPFYRRKRFVFGISAGIALILLTVIIVIFRHAMSIMPVISITNPTINWNKHTLEVTLGITSPEYDKLRICSNGYIKVKRCGMLIVDDALKIGDQSSLLLFPGFQGNLLVPLSVPLLPSVAKSDLLTECPPEKYEYSVGYRSIQIVHQ